MKKINDSLLNTLLYLYTRENGLIYRNHKWMNYEIMKRINQRQHRGFEIEQLASIFVFARSLNESYAIYLFIFLLKYNGDFIFFDNNDIEFLKRSNANDIIKKYRREKKELSYYKKIKNIAKDH